MLVAISDLHFVDGTAGEHNLPYSAFESIFLSDIASLAKDKTAREIKILLLGDIIDPIRSTQWFDIAPADRPWGSNGLMDVPIPRGNSLTERQALKILGQVPETELQNSQPPGSLPKNTVLYKNWNTFKLFREFGSRLKSKFGVDLPVEIIYVPGNHDRLCNLYPAIRTALRQILGLTVNSNTVEDDSTGQWWYRYDFTDESYGVYGQHGHQHDIWNYSGGNDYTFKGYLQVPIGEVFTTEFGAKIPYKLALLRDTYPQISAELINNLKDIDNVRPLSRVMEWIYYRIKKEDNDEIRKALNQALDEVVKELLDNEFVRKWRSPATTKDEVLRAICSPWLSWIPKGVVALLGAKILLPFFMSMIGDVKSPEKDVYTRAAYHEKRWKENSAIRFILYGHTHVPVQLPLDRERGREILYLNTGTWRNRIYKTVELDKSPDFVELKQMTYSIFYGKDEDTTEKIQNTVSFDVWTGAKKKFYA